MKYNSDQLKAVRHFKGPALVLAGPGSGKTSVITGRTLRLIENHRVPPENILVITFSRKAAQEMEQRFLRNWQGGKRPCFSTFHSFFFRILKNVYRIDNSSLLTETEKLRFLSECCRRILPEQEITEDFCFSMIREIGYIKSGAGYIENAAPEGISPPQFRKLFHGYQKYLRENGRIDFDDMVLLCRNLLKEREEICRFYQQQYPFILVDEFQDISPMQYEIVKLLAAPRQNLFVVGDDDQSIYAFRGARPELMRSFLKDFPKAAKITLQVNYRCAPAILEAARKVIRRNRNRMEKQQVSSKQNVLRGSVQIKACPDLYEQYLEVALDIRRLFSRGASPDSVAILLRNTTHIPMLLKVLAENGVPVGRVAAGGARFDAASESRAQAASGDVAHAVAGRVPQSTSRGVPQSMVGGVAHSANGIEQQPPAGIAVMTIHAAKGLEFDHVFLPDLNEGALPVGQARKPAQIEEERRVFYVGITRAAKTLSIYCCTKRRQRKTAPSRFLADLLK